MIDFMVKQGSDVYQASLLLPGWSDAADIRAGTTRIVEGALREDGLGWPRLAAHTRTVYDQRMPPRFEDRHLPIRPIWPGFAINTIFYAAILWVVFLVPRSVKRLRRRAKGCCIHCGYDLRGQPADSKTCPECGRAS
jgi:hypothetical protein